MKFGDSKYDLKSWLLQSIVVAVLYLGLDMFFHGFILKDVYQAHFQHFRSMDEVMALRWWGYAGYLMFGLLFTCIFSQGYQEGSGNVGQGLRYGLLIGLFYWGTRLLVDYPYTPWPNILYFGWLAIGLFEFALLGTILGVLYKPKAAA